MREAVKDDAEAQKLRRSLHEKIDRLPVSKLAKADHLLLQIEVDELRAELDLAFDQDRKASKLTGEKISEAIALHRARHPYKG
jgi:hypothetical protein